MGLEIVSLALGMTMTNTYLVCENESKKAVVIDPGWDGTRLVEEANQRGWDITQIWLTHAHFDHLGGAGEVAKAYEPVLPVALHPEDKWLWEMQGGASLFGIDGIDPGPEPSIALAHGNTLKLGNVEFEVRHAPGHTPGHVMFYCEQESVMFCGDVIFRTSIGRTDLPRGDFETLLTSIREQVFTLPEDTRLLNGHGPETTVGFEKDYNPFL
jgi:glyoxylase-like metal-dependent hydrolase (beta-lactamase superfamily II)